MKLKIFLGGTSIGGISSIILDIILRNVRRIIFMNATFYLDISILEDKKNLKVFAGEGVLDEGAHSEAHLGNIIDFPNVEVHYYEDGKHDIYDGELVGIEEFLKKNII